jgi:hypothetical protein
LQGILDQKHTFQHVTISLLDSMPEIHLHNLIGFHFMSCVSDRVIVPFNEIARQCLFHRLLLLVHAAQLDAIRIVLSKYGFILYLGEICFDD